MPCPWLMYWLLIKKGVVEVEGEAGWGIDRGCICVTMGTRREIVNQFWVFSITLPLLLGTILSQSLSISATVTNQISVLPLLLPKPVEAPVYWQLWLMLCFCKVIHGCFSACTTSCWITHFKIWVTMLNYMWMEFMLSLIPFIFLTLTPLSHKPHKPHRAWSALHVFELQTAMLPFMLCRCLLLIRYSITDSITHRLWSALLCTLVIIS